MIDLYIVTFTLHSTGEVAPGDNKKEFTQQETASVHNLSDHTSLMNNEVNNEVDNEVMDSDSKTITDNDKMATTSSSSDSSSSNNSTLIAEVNTETVQVQPMGSLMVSNSDTQPQPIVTSGKENVQDDSLRSVSDQSTMSLSCEKVSETVTHSITQPKMIGELL